MTLSDFWSKRVNVSSGFFEWTFNWQLRPFLSALQLGAVANKVADAVKAAAQGQVDPRFATTSIVHAGLGKVFPGLFPN